MARFAPILVMACLVLPTQALAESNQELAGVLSICRGGTEAAVATAQRLRGDAAVSAASVLPNPSLVLEHQRTLSGPADRETMVGLSVPLGVGGRRGVLQQAAHARRRQAFAEARAGLFDAALEFREAYARAAVEQAREQVFAQNQFVLDSLTTVIQKLEGAGEAAAYDKLRQEAQARVHRQRLRIATAKAGAARRRLRAWLDKDVAIGEADSVALAGNDDVPRGAAAPELEVLQAEAQASELEARAARRRAVPDVSILAGYRAVTAGSETGHGISLGLELPLTLFDHGQGESFLAEADAQLFWSLAQRHKRRNEATMRAGLASLAELRAALSESQAAVRDVLTAREKAMQLYAAGEASITELLDAGRAAEEAQLMRLDLVQDIALTRFGVMRAAGTQLDATLDRECRDGKGQGGR